MAILYETPVVPSEFTSLQTQGVSPASSGTVVFSGLDPKYGYELFYYSPDNNVGYIENIPKYTNVRATIVSHNNQLTLTLTYTISGGTDGLSQFALKQLAK